MIQENSRVSRHSQYRYNSQMSGITADLDLTQQPTSLNKQLQDIEISLAHGDRRDSISRLLG